MLASSMTAAWAGCNALIDNESATYAPFSDGGPDGGAGMDATLVIDGSSVDGRCAVGSCYVAGTPCYYPVNQPLNVQCCFPFLCSDAGGGLTTCQ